jgi:hypothetical protein
MIRFAVDEDFNNDVVRALGRNLRTWTSSACGKRATAGGPTPTFSLGRRRKGAFSSHTT